MVRSFLLAGWMLATAIAVPRPVDAQESGQRVHRCVGARGEIVFSGLPCATEAAAATQLPVGEASATAACPASSAELRQRIGAAIARKDANALAGLIRWQGIGGGEAGSRLGQLRQLAQRPLLAIEADGGEPDAAASAADSLRVRTGSNEQDGVREHRFGVLLESGCYWLTW
ncbi:hypothetical protein [Dokdonella sp.]|uniref:hypothetical protein n=1 Tax=Dokdonella sp. TaxID=2291710 RepID=UPI001B1FF6C2|nr:hypothetical protein [Dokdonella sp.]MBO9664617.1 hypothetical protein [Dokdonella sp.]